MIDYKAKLIRTYIAGIVVGIVVIVDIIMSTITMHKLNKENIKLRTELESYRDTEYINRMLKNEEVSNWKI